MECADGKTVKDLIGKTFTKVYKGEIPKGYSSGNEALFFENDQEIFAMSHEQNCCEGVVLEDVTGDLNDLIGTPILEAREDVNDNPELEDKWDSQTWTFYNLRTQKGYVSLRWVGESNGYYSESVDFFHEVKKKNTIGVCKK